MHPGRLTFNAKNNTDYAMIARLDQLSISTDYSIIVNSNFHSTSFYC